MLIAFHKPYGVLSQFTAIPGSRFRTLAGFGFPKGVYPVGRLDAKSEGLLLLSDEPWLNYRLLHPRFHHRRVYWAQVEGIPTEGALEQLRRGVRIAGGYRTQPCQVWMLETPLSLPPRTPPIRFRKTVPTSWLALELTEGKYHEVRRMTAAIGHPTLRLIRVQIGDFELWSLRPGEWRILTPKERAAVLAL
ncbi:MAG: pseudouridine synthase [Candidatus Kapabacteria bacterium]|nr:pseudouridine synthase [Candidatus Kapabacteria bacterium]MDW8225713.1 pseudouridine synthase [Bacteroidota bacterium]